MTKREQKLFDEGLEKYPVSTVIIENLFMFLWIVIGSVLCWVFMPFVAWVYLLFGFTMVLWVMRIVVCKNCYYHGKWCHTGWGKLSAIYCQPGELSNFCCGVGGVIVPVFYGFMALVPLISGVISIIKVFSVFKMIIIIVFLFVVIMSSVILRKKSCMKCKMRNLCPGSAV